MRDKRYVICGNEQYDVPKELETDAIHFHLYGPEDKYKLNFDIELMKGMMLGNISKRFKDLLEIAVYVVTADQVSGRGRASGYKFDNLWYRDFHFVIPVRDFDFWSSEPVKQCLRQTLWFLSDDEYEFEFVPMKAVPTSQSFFDIHQDEQGHDTPQQVVMFSGGLDSLAGAIAETLGERKRIICVNHRSNTKQDKRHKNLEQLLKEKTKEYAPDHIRVSSHKQEWMGSEYTQRTRSFLFVTLGATIAHMRKLSSVRFYENGVVSLNLPVCAQVVGGRATRTTHPRSLASFERLLSLVTEAPFRVDNPFGWKTKVEVIQSIIDAGCQDLIQHSVSCAHVWTTSNEHPHCGTCSQCIDRRFAIVAAKAEEYDPLSQFAADIFMEGRDKDVHVIEDKTMFATYVDRANKADVIENSMDFLCGYPEVTRVLEFVAGNDQTSALDRVFGLYKRHAREVQTAINTMLTRDPNSIRTLSLPANSLLRVIMDRSYPVSVPAIPVVEASPDNIFRRRGNVWELRFNGQTSFNLSNCDTGCRYIHQLLANPGKSFEVWYMVHKTSTEAIDEALNESEEVTDRQALAALNKKVRELRQDIEEAKDCKDYIQQEKLEEELEKIIKQIRTDTGLGGKIRTVSRGKDNCRTSFCNAFVRAIAAIRETDASLADYLTKSIRRGANPEYQPPESIQWETDHVFNP